MPSTKNPVAPLNVSGTAQATRGIAKVLVTDEANSRVAVGGDPSSGRTFKVYLVGGSTAEFVAATGAAYLDLAAQGNSSEMIWALNDATTVMGISNANSAYWNVISSAGLRINLTANTYMRFGTNSVERMAISSDGVVLSTILQLKKGSDLTAAGSVTVGAGNLFTVNGTTTINYLSTSNLQAGAFVILMFTASVTVTHNAGAPGAGFANIKLAGSANFASASGDNLTLVYDGTDWQETSRKLA